MAGVVGRRFLTPCSHLYADNQTTKELERVFVWIHVLTILGFLAYLPRSKHLHIFSRRGQRLVRPHAGLEDGSRR